MGWPLSSEKEYGGNSRNAILVSSQLQQTPSNVQSLDTSSSETAVMGKTPRCLQLEKGIPPKGSWELPVVSQLQTGPGV